MKLWKRLIPLLIALFFLISCKESNVNMASSNLQLKEVVLQLKWQHQFQFAGYYAAIDQGYYEDVGIKVKLVEAFSFIDPVESVLQGYADFGIGSSDILISFANDEPVVALAAIFQHSPLVLVVNTESSISHIHDIVGKRVMLEPHSDELFAYFIFEGFSVEQLIQYPHIFDPSPLINNEVDAMSAYITDEIYLLEEAEFSYKLFSPRTGGIDFYSDILFTTQNTINNDPQLIKDFLEASFKGWDYAFNNEDQVIDLILSEYSTRHTREHLKYEAQRMRELIMPDIIEIGYMNSGRWEHIADTYAKLGMIPENTDLENFIFSNQVDHQIQWKYTIIGSSIVILTLLLIIGLSSSLQCIIFYFKKLFSFIQNFIKKRSNQKANNHTIKRE